MQTICISKEFIDNLFVESDKDEFTKDLVKYISSEIHNIRLICNLSSIIEYKKALIDNPLWELLMDKYDKIKFNVDLESELYEDAFYENLDEQNLFLVSISDTECEKLTKSRGYIYISSSDIAKSWKTIKYVRENSLFKVTCDSHFPCDLKFDCWSKLEKSLLPITSIVIFDKHILKDKTNQKLSDNLFKLLKILCKSQDLLKPITITIITEFDNDAQVVSAHSKIEEFFVQNSITNTKLNIIRHNKSKYPNDFEGLHYRLILTNNLRIKCDDSFNFFKANGKVNNDADLHISFNLSIPFKYFYEKELKHLNRYVSKISNVDSDVNLIDKIYVYKDKENYLFN